MPHPRRTQISLKLFLKSLPITIAAAALFGVPYFLKMGDDDAYSGKIMTIAVVAKIITI